MDDIEGSSRLPGVGTDWLPAGSRDDHRAFVGPPAKYDLVSAMQFNVLTSLGLRETHSLLDIGCGSLRGGRLFITYLLPRLYFGLEPEEWLVREGIEKEIGRELIAMKEPSFLHRSDFELTAFDKTFDFLLAQSIFTHASREQIGRCLAQARDVMHLESIFAATYIKGDEDYDGDAWVYPATTRYTAESMTLLVHQAGLACHELDWPHPNKHTWLAIYDPERPEKPASIPVQPGTASPREAGERERSPLERELAATRARLRESEQVVASLRTEVQSLRQYLSRLQGHPYVRLGLRMRRLFRRATRHG